MCHATRSRPTASHPSLYRRSLASRLRSWLFLPTRTIADWHLSPPPLYLHPNGLFLLPMATASAAGVSLTGFAFLVLMFVPPDARVCCADSSSSRIAFSRRRALLTTAAAGMTAPQGPKTGDRPSPEGRHAEHDLRTTCGSSFEKYETYLIIGSGPQHPFLRGGHTPRL